MLNHWLVLIYTAGAISELTGVGLVVKQFRDARGLWRSHTAAVEQQRAAVASDPRWSFDEMYSRYGILPGEIQRSSATIRSLLEVNERMQIWTVVLLVAGIVLGTIGNMVSLAG
ncbi:hypothetical protein PD653_0998 [Nocardioides sp. PD653]|nr:hypothetical protein PD653B2_0413 [Nocardioides sp. PD653-B2]GAW53597.1 hypothetical protein PD653_0998 [Nocardioides sp. PD653]